MTPLSRLWRSPSFVSQFVLGSLLLAGLGIGGWFLLADGDPPTQEERIEEIDQRMGRGVPENPDARLDYEKRRLQNPETGKIPDNIRKKELAFAKNLPERLRKATSWKPRGPTNKGGRSRALAVDARSSDGDTILAGGVSGGMWRTTDGGSSWTRTFDPDQRPSVTSLAQDTRSERGDVWYAGSGEWRGNSASGGGAFYLGAGIYKSTDGGQSWQLLDNTEGEETDFDSDFDFVHAIEVDPSAPKDGSEGTDSEVYAATYDGIYRSVDGGATWTLVLEGDQGSGSTAAYTDVEVTSSGEVYAALSSDGGRNGIFYSATGDPISDDPNNWVDITPNNWPDSFQRTLLGVAPSNADLWAVTDGGSDATGHALWKFDRSRQAWTDYTDYIPDRGTFGGSFSSQGSYDLVVEVDPDNGNVIYLGGVNLWRIDVSASASDANSWIGGYTPDGGAGLYNPPGSDRQHPDQHAIAFDPGNGDVMYVGSDGGIHRTDDNQAGGTGTAGDGDVLYTSLNNGYFTTQFYTVCQYRNPDTPEENRFLAGGMQDNGTWGTTSSDVSDPWDELLSGDGSFCSVTNNATDDGASHYRSSQNGRVFRFGFDSNGNFLGADEITPSSASGQLFIHPFALDPSDADVMYYPAGDSLWRKTDLETNPSQTSGWENMTGAAVPSGNTITALGVSVSNSANVLYYGTDSGNVYRLPNANTVTAGASDTTVVTGADFPSGGYVSSIAVDPTDSDKVMVVFSNYEVKSIFYSTDGGSSWTDVEGNLSGSTGPSIRSATILPQDGLNQTTYYIGTSVGLYSTTSLAGSNTSWTQEAGTEIGDVVVDQVQARLSDGRVIAATHANGTYSFNAPLPVEMADFDATAQEQSVVLAWKTASETNNSGFAVEHKYRDGGFEKVGFVEGEGTTSSPQSYRYEVGSTLEPGSHTFRLKQVDLDGTTSYSEPREVTLSPAGTYSLTQATPNPFHQRTTMRLTVAEAQPVTATLYNTLGQRVRTVLDREVSANRPVDLQFNANDLASGMYVVRIEGEGFEATRKVTLVK